MSNIFLIENAGNSADGNLAKTIEMDLHILFGGYL